MELKKLYFLLTALATSRLSSASGYSPVTTTTTFHHSQQYRPQQKTVTKLYTRPAYATTAVQPTAQVLPLISASQPAYYAWKVKSPQPSYVQPAPQPTYVSLKPKSVPTYEVAPQVVVQPPTEVKVLPGKHASGTYSYAYTIQDNKGNFQTRKEESDGSGKVTGSYGYIDPKGVYRKVQYVADENGFRASISTSQSTVTTTKAAPKPQSHVVLVPIPAVVKTPVTETAVLSAQSYPAVGPDSSATKLYSASQHPAETQISSLQNQEAIQFFPIFPQVPVAPKAVSTGISTTNDAPNVLTNLGTAAPLLALQLPNGILIPIQASLLTSDLKNLLSLIAPNSASSPLGTAATSGSTTGSAPGASGTGVVSASGTRTSSEFASTSSVSSSSGSGSS